MRLPGRATAEGTQRFENRHLQNCASAHFRITDDLFLSSIGIGTYSGRPDDNTDSLLIDAIIESVKKGVNFIDTAINYRYERAEKCVGESIHRLIKAGEITRDELFVCTKGGVIPHPNPIAWFRKTYVEGKKFGISVSDLAANIHCMHPIYLRDQLQKSLENLGLDTVDLYYLHSPESQLAEFGPKVFWERLRQAFEVLEEAARSGRIGNYGLATWNAFRVPPEHPEHIDLHKAKSLAKKVSGSEPDHFRFIQVPINLAMLEAMLATQKFHGELVPILEAARQLKIDVIASASLGQGKILGKLPPHLANSLGQDLTDAQRALHFTRSIPGLLTSLVGMKGTAHVKENLQLASRGPLNPEEFLKTLGAGG